MPGRRRRHQAHCGLDCQQSAASLMNGAADKAVKDVFAILGVDISNPESIEDFRASLRFVRQTHRVVGHGILAFIAIVAAALATVVWSGLAALIRRGIE